ncbi:unnamed protein product [Rhizophagus irregularis]|nr:unnamed protein product [Rhizophagus irregularis]
MMAWKFSSEIFRVSGVWTLVDDLDFISTLEVWVLNLVSIFKACRLQRNFGSLDMKFYQLFETSLTRIHRS